MQLFAATKMYAIEKLSSCYQELYVELLCTWSCNGKNIFLVIFMYLKILEIRWASTFVRFCNNSRFQSVFKIKLINSSLYSSAFCVYVTKCQFANLIFFNWFVLLTLLLVQ
jgi:hypothetical protein